MCLRAAALASVTVACTEASACAAPSVCSRTHRSSSRLPAGPALRRAAQPCQHGLSLAVLRLWEMHDIGTSEGGLQPAPTRPRCVQLRMGSCSAAPGGAL